MLLTFETTLREAASDPAAVRRFTRVTNHAIDLATLEADVERWLVLAHRCDPHPPSEVEDVANPGMSALAAAGLPRSVERFAQFVRDQIWPQVPARVRSPGGWLPRGQARTPSQAAGPTLRSPAGRAAALAAPSLVGLRADAPAAIVARPVPTPPPAVGPGR